MASKAEMALILSLVEEVSKTAKDVKERLRSTGEAAQVARLNVLDQGRGLLALGAGGLAAGATLLTSTVKGIGQAAFAAGAGYDDAMDSIAIATGATGEELAALGDDFSDLFSSIPADTKTAAGVIGELNRTLGVSGEALVDLARPLAEASRMLGTDAAKSAKGFGQAMNAWKVDAADAPAMLDSLFVATQRSGIGFEALLKNLAAFAPTLQATGFGLSESAGLLGELEKAGMLASDAMTALEMAAKTFTEAGAPLREGLLASIESIQGAGTAQEALALGMQTFGSKAALPMVEAIRSGKFNLEEMTAALQASSGAILETAAATADFPEKLQVLSNAGADALAPLGLAMMDTVTTLVERFTPAFQAASGWLHEQLVPALQAVADAVGLVLAGDLNGAIASLFGDEVAARVMSFLDGLKLVWAYIQDNPNPILSAAGAVIVTTVVPAFVAWAGAAVPAAAATIAAAAPVILLVAGIGAAVFLLAKAWQENWGGIQERTEAVIENIRGRIDRALGQIRDFWAKHGEAILAIVKGLWESIKWVFSTLFDVLTGIVDAFILAIEGDWYGFGQKLRETWLELKEKLLSVWKQLWEGIKRLATDAIEAIVEWFGELPGKIIRFFVDTDWAAIGQNILRGIASGLTAGLDWLKDAARKVAQAALDAMKGLLGIHSPSKVAELQVGAPIGEGIVAGLRRGTPDLLAASRGILNDSIGLMSGMGSMTQSASLASRAQSANEGGTIRSFTTEALQQLFEMIAASITLPLAPAIVAQLRGESKSDMGAALRALSAA